MSSFTQKVKNFLNPKHRRFACDSELVRNQKQEVIRTDLSFNEVLNETKELTGSIIAMIEEERKKAKALFYAFNSASDALVIVDENGMIAFVNNKFLDLYGYSSDTEILGKNMNILRSLSTSNEFYQDMWSTIKSNSYWQGELYNVAKDGSIVRVLSKILPIMNGKPSPIYYVCTQTKLKGN